MSDPKFYCRAEDLAIGYGKTPLMEHIGLSVEKVCTLHVRHRPPEFG